MQSISGIPNLTLKMPLSHMENLAYGTAPINSASAGQTVSKVGDEPLNFAAMLQGALQEVSAAQQLSDEMTMGMLLGSVEIHQATIAMEKATLTLRTFISVRDKMLEAYQEIMRMQV